EGRAPTHALGARSRGPDPRSPGGSTAPRRWRSTSDGRRGGDSARAPNLDHRSRPHRVTLQVQASRYLTLPLIDPGRWGAVPIDPCTRVVLDGFVEPSSHPSRSAPVRLTLRGLGGSFERVSRSRLSLRTPPSR